MSNSSRIYNYKNILARVFFKSDLYSNAGEDGEQQELQSLLAGMQSETGTCKTVWQLLAKLKHDFAVGFTKLCS